MRVDPQEVKAESERRIQGLGGSICDWLPTLERHVPRTSREAADRGLVLHAMLQIHFGAPAPIIDRWLLANDLQNSISKRDRRILSAGDADLTQKDVTDLYWYIEALWAMVWAGQLIPDLPIESPVGDILASLLPKLQRNELASQFRGQFRLRPPDELYSMLDLYYRAHWYARDGRLRSQSTGVFNLDIIMERRRALEWLNDGNVRDWDETEDST